MLNTLTSSIPLSELKIYRIFQCSRIHKPATFENVIQASLQEPSITVGSVRAVCQNVHYKYYKYLRPFARAIVTIYSFKKKNKEDDDYKIRPT